MFTANQKNLSVDFKLKKYIIVVSIKSYYTNNF